MILENDHISISTKFLNRKRKILKIKQIVGWINILLLSVSFAAIPNGYYDNAANKTETELKTALHDIIDGHSVESYDDLWVDFESTDITPSDNVWDMYSDIPGGTPFYQYDYSGSDQCGNYSGEGSCFNREHSWPKSWFNDVSPMNTDLFHLYPTDGYVNGRRSNYPFGEVASPTWTSTNGSKVGPCSYSGYSGTVFEPIDEYKGDFARTYFYMSTRYYNEDTGWDTNDMVDGAELKEWAVNMLLEWHNDDPVSQKELDRNEAVYNIQGNRNPFIDHAEYVAKIWDPESVGEEISNHVNNFSTSTTTKTSIRLIWTENDGATAPDGYLIKANTGSVTSPSDGTDPADDTDLTNGSGNVQVSHGSSSYTFDNCLKNTTYNFKIFPYINSGSSIDYKTDGTVPEDSRKTPDNIIMTYNTWNYGDDPTADNDREDDFRDIISEIDPDVLIVEEIHGETAFSTFLSDVLNYSVSGLYAGTWIDQENVLQDIGLYYKTNQYSVLSTQLIDITSTFGLRDALEVKLKHTASNVEFYTYGLHLKAGNTTSDQTERTSQTSALRTHCNSLATNTPFIITGDLNLYTSSENAWINLTGSSADNDGRVFDPINQSGDWNNNPTFAAIHTQNTHDDQGGLDDRFDFLLISDAVNSTGTIEYQADTYTSFGNDGDHFNSSINYQTNNAVSAALADALYNASDHLPVYAGFSFTEQSGSDPSGMYISEYSDASGTGNYIYEFVEIYNNSNSAVSIDGYTLRQQNSTQFFTIPTGTSIPGKGFLVVGRDADQSSFESFWNTTLSASVIYLNSGDNVPMINGDEVYLFEDSDGNNIDPATDDEYSAQAISSGYRVYRKTTGNTTSDWVKEPNTNSSPGTLNDHEDQSLPVKLSCFEAIIKDDQVVLKWTTESECNNLGFNIYRSYSKNQFTKINPVLISGAHNSSEQHNYSFVDKKIIKNTRYYYQLEDVSLTGVVEKHDIIDVFINSDVRDNILPEKFELLPAYPNPFNPVTNIKLNISNTRNVKLQVYNIAGELVNTINNSTLNVGSHTFTWNASDHRGVCVSSGVYFLKMTIDNKQTCLQKVLLAR